MFEQDKPTNNLKNVVVKQQQQEKFIFMAICHDNLILFRFFFLTKLNINSGKERNKKYKLDFK